MDPLLSYVLSYVPFYFPKIQYEHSHEEQLDAISEGKSKGLRESKLKDELIAKHEDINEQNEVMAISDTKENNISKENERSSPLSSTHEQNEVKAISNIKKEHIKYEGNQPSPLSSTHERNQLSPFSSAHEGSQFSPLSSTHGQNKETIVIRLDYFNKAKTEITYSLKQTLTFNKRKMEDGIPVNYEFYYPFLNKDRDINYRNNNKYPEIMKLNLAYFNHKTDLSKVGLVYPMENSISSSNSIKDSEEETEYPGLIFNTSIDEHHMKRENNLTNIQIQQENKSDIYDIFERNVEHSPRSSINIEEFLVFQQSQDIDLVLNNSLEITDSNKTQSNKDSYDIFERNIESNKNSLAKTINLNDIFDNNIEDTNQFGIDSPRLSFHLPKIPTEPFRPFDSPTNRSTSLLKSDESIKQPSIKYTPYLMEDIKFHPISESSKRDINSIQLEDEHLEHNNFSRFQSIKFKFLKGFKKIKLPKHKHVHVEELDAIH